MLQILQLLTILYVVCEVYSHPVHELNIQPDYQSEEVVYVPYDVKYVPIEVSSAVSKSVLEKELKSLPFPSLKDIEIKNESVTEDGSEENTKDDTNQVQQNEKTLLNDFDKKFSIDESKSSEDFVLVPISLLKSLRVQAKVDSSRSTHIVSKRQAPGDELVYRPIVQLRRVSRNRRRVYRRPPLVGYLNDYDRFPTLA